LRFLVRRNVFEVLRQPPSVSERIHDPSVPLAPECILQR
jgi:hypothetical protein